MAAVGSCVLSDIRHATIGPSRPAWLGPFFGNCRIKTVRNLRKLWTEDEDQKLLKLAAGDEIPRVE